MILDCKMVMTRKIAKIIRYMPCSCLFYDFVLYLWKALVTPYRCHRLQCKGAQVLHELHELLTILDVRYYVYWGTLLGVVREKNFIPYDDDIDISIKSTQFDFRRALDIFEKHGFKFLQAVQTKEQVLYYTFSRLGIHIDLFCEIGRKDDTYIYTPETIRKDSMNYVGFQCSWRVCPIIDGGDGETIRFKGGEIRIPCRAEAVLLSMYGDSWRVPQKGIKFSRSFEWRDDIADCVFEPKKVLQA